MNINFVKGNYLKFYFKSLMINLKIISSKIKYKNQNKF